MRKWLRTIAVGVVVLIAIWGALVGVLSSLNHHLPTPSSTAANYTTPSFLDLVNQARAKNNKPALTEDTALDQAAQARNATMIQQAVWNHVGSDGSQWYSVDEQYAPQRTHYGENLSRCWNSTTEVVNGWVSSPEHYAILMGDFTRVGFNAVYETKTITDSYHPGNQTFSNCYIVAAEFSN